VDVVCCTCGGVLGWEDMLKLAVFPSDNPVCTSCYKRASVDRLVERCVEDMANSHYRQFIRRQQHLKGQICNDK